MKISLKQATITTSLLVLLLVDGISGYVHAPARNAIATHGSSSRWLTKRSYLAMQTDSLSNEIVATEEDEEKPEPTAVRAPLKYIGPYPCLALHFPDLATSSQRSRNATGISLDFVLDTAANTNTINSQVAQELGLEVVGSVLPGVGAGGPIAGGDTYLLGDCQLDGLPKEEKFTFMTGLIASALPVASPAAAGLLSSAFFACFDGGVEFVWGAANTDGQITTPPSVTFHGKEGIESIIKDKVRVPIRPLPVTLLPSVMIRVNGVEMPALLDTGSPITVLNKQAAEEAGIKSIQKPEVEKSNNPFAALANSFKEAQAAAEAASRGDVLTIAGTTGERVDLLKSATEAELSFAVDSGDSAVDLGSGNVYIGNLPGLAALDGLGDESPPAVVLGMDWLRSRPKMLLRGANNELYL